MAGRRRDTRPVGPPRPRSAVDQAEELPDLFRQLSDNPRILIAEEQQYFALCEAAIETLRAAFWAAGKALQIIRDAKLYRVDYANFEAYCEERWGIGRDYADRLIRAWPLAERLHQNEWKRTNEAQIRELVPLGDKYGIDAAVLVYETVAGHEDTPTTAAVLKGAVAALPRGDFDTEIAVEHIRAYLAGLGAPADPEPVAPSAALSAEARRIRFALQRHVKRGTFMAVARENPDEVRRIVAELRDLLDEVERDALSPDPAGDQVQ